MGYACLYKCIKTFIETEVSNNICRMQMMSFKNLWDSIKGLPSKLFATPQQTSYEACSTLFAVLQLKKPSPLSDKKQKQKDYPVAYRRQNGTNVGRVHETGKKANRKRKVVSYKKFMEENIDESFSSLKNNGRDNRKEQKALATLPKCSKKETKKIKQDIKGHFTNQDGDDISSINYKSEDAQESESEFLNFAFGAHNHHQPLPFYHQQAQGFFWQPYNQPCNYSPQKQRIHFREQPKIQVDKPIPNMKKEKMMEELEKSFRKNLSVSDSQQENCDMENIRKGRVQPEEGKVLPDDLVQDKQLQIQKHIRRY